MKPELIMEADILDIIFENRNKDYGAYNLRKQYNHRVNKAVMIVFGLVSTLFIVHQIGFSFGTKSGKLIQITPDVVLVEVYDRKLPKTTVEATTKAATLRHNNPIIVKEEPVETVRTLTELANDVLIGTGTIEGPSADGSQGPLGDENETVKTDEPVEPNKEENKVLIKAEFMPEFPGGQAAFMRFLSKHLRVPENALQPGEKTRVLVRFVVGERGEIYNIEFLETSGEIFEQEVLRVMKKMPSWKPGRQNGQNVQVYFKLPIVFDAPQD